MAVNPSDRAALSIPRSASQHPLIGNYAILATVRPNVLLSAIPYISHIGSATSTNQIKPRVDGGWRAEFNLLTLR
jgi:hypothetical protein